MKCLLKQIKAASSVEEFKDIYLEISDYNLPEWAITYLHKSILDHMKTKQVVSDREIKSAFVKAK